MTVPNKLFIQPYNIMLIAPGFIAVWVKYSGLNRKWQQAADTYSKAATLEPDNFWHYDQLGDAWCYLNQWERAAEAYQKATTFYPDRSSIYNRLGKTLVKLQQCIGC